MKSNRYHPPRLVSAIGARLRGVLPGTPSWTWRTCGTVGCRCHSRGPKHGPHLYVSYRGPAGKTVGYYVPQAFQAEATRRLAAWQEVQRLLRRLGALNETAFRRQWQRRRPYAPSR